MTKIHGFVKTLPGTCWWPLWELFETVLGPKERILLYDAIKDLMPVRGSTGRGWYSSDRSKSSVCSSLFPPEYRHSSGYDRIFPCPRTVQAVQLEEGKKQRYSTLTGSDRSFKKLCLSTLNLLMESRSFPFKFVELDLISCHARILAGLFPEQTPNLNRIFEEGLSLWDGIIKTIPQEALDLIKKEANPKALIKIIAYKTLQTGFLGPQTMIEVEERLGFVDQGSREEVLQILETKQVLTEFTVLFREAQQRLQLGHLEIHSLFSAKTLAFRRPKNYVRPETQSERRKETIETDSGVYTPQVIRCCSSVLVGVEQLLLILFVKTHNQGFGIPISLEHDGCLTLVDLRKGGFDLESFNEQFKLEVEQCTGFKRMEVESKDLDIKRIDSLPWPRKELNG